MENKNTLPLVNYEMIVNWVSECWKGISEELIRKSFVQCGIVGDSPAKLHQRLKSLLADDNLDDQYEHSGLTDDEVDEEESAADEQA